MTRYLITGAARGIGLEFVSQLLANGDEVHAAARAVSPALAALHAGAAGRCTLHALDMADPAGFPALAAAIGATASHLDVLVNVAGVYSRHSTVWNPETTGLDALAADDLDYVFRVNSVGPMLLAKACLPLLARAERGRVVNLSSLLGSVGHKTTGADYAYCASKAALNIMTRALAVDLAPRGIIALAMTPGWVRTDMGGENASRSVEKGAETAVWLAMLPHDGPSGGFFRDRKPIPW